MIRFKFAGDTYAGRVIDVIYDGASVAEIEVETNTDRDNSWVLYPSSFNTIRVMREH